MEQNVKLSYKVVSMQFGPEFSKFLLFLNLQIQEYLKIKNTSDDFLTSRIEDYF